MLSVLSALSDEHAQEHPNGEWSAKQQIAHLVAGEPGWLGWALAVYHEPGITVGQAPEVEQPFLRDVAEADSKPLAWWLSRLGETRAQTLQRIDEINLSSADAINRRGVHRTFGEMTVLSRYNRDSVASTAMTACTQTNCWATSSLSHRDPVHHAGRSYVKPLNHL